MSQRIVIEHKIDFEACGREPVHTPGSIQGYGILLGLSLPRFSITHISDNSFRLIGRYAEELLDRPLAEVFGTAAVQQLSRAASELANGDHHRCRLETVPPLLPQAFDATLRAWRGHWLLELEPAVAPPVPTSLGAEAFQTRLDQAATVYDLARAAVLETMRLVAYDHIMVYRLFEDGSGEVVAEDRPVSTTPLLGLRFPPHDFPPPAQRLQTLLGVRMVVDMNATDAKVLTTAQIAQTEPLDMSPLNLRSVSRFCVQYHRNIGVAGTLTISIPVADRLWGFISCHSQTPRQIGPALRDAARTVGRRLGQALGALEVQRDQRIDQRRRRRATMLHAAALGGDDFLVRVMLQSPRLTQLFGATGAALVVGDDVFRRGATPSVDDLRRFSAWVAEAAEPDGLFQSNQISARYPSAVAWEATCCGVLAIVLGHTPSACLVCFRPELRLDVHWGGDPHAAVERDAQQRLIPRGSFERWRYQVRGQCRHWTDADVALMRLVAHLLRVHLGNSEAARAAAMRQAVQACRNAFEQNEVLREELLAATSEYMMLTIRDEPNGLCTVAHINQRLCELFDLDPSEVEDRPVESVLPLLAIPMDFLNHAEVPPVDMEIWSDVIGLRTMRISRTVIAETAGPNQARLLLLRLQDVTEFRRTTEALKAAREQSHAAEQAKTRFLANMSHELRSPLNAIIGFAEAIKSELMGPVGASIYRDYARDIGRSGQHLLSLISDLLDLSRLEAGRRMLEEQDFNLTEILDDIMRWMETQFRDKGLVWEHDMPRDTLVLRGDASAIRQILINLITNAGKYTPAGGWVRVRALAPPDGDLVITVEDNGIGIEPAEISRLFQPFVRANDVRSEEISGTGLGLAISKALIELHGGRIEIASDGRTGTTVRLLLPRWRHQIRLGPAAAPR